jgi:hypothetical protein
MDSNVKDYRSLWHSTVRNTKHLSAEEVLLLFQNGMFSEKPIIIEEFLIQEFIEREPQEHELFHQHWNKAFDLSIMHSSIEDIAQFVCEVIFLDDDNFGKLRHDIVSLKKENDFWKICSVHKILLSDENKHPVILPLSGNGLILPGTIDFINEFDWSSDDSDEISIEQRYANQEEVILKMCKEEVTGFDGLPQEIQQFYLKTASTYYNSERQLDIDFLDIRLN